jgi:MoaA/NifB/PqqE/SkfB family radical SAM enzyme
MVSPLEIVKRRLSISTHRICTLPVLTLVLHSRCNCRCIMCDIWKAGGDGSELKVEHLRPHLAALERLGVHRVVLSGGEPLLHPDLWTLCELLRAHGVSVITLLSTGRTLRQHREAVVRWCDDVIVSLDGSPRVHDSIRNVPGAYERLAEGISALKALDPYFRMTGRCTLQRANYADLSGIVQTAHHLGLGQISFMAADVSTRAFNRPTPWESERRAQVALTPDEVQELRRLVEELIVEEAGDLASGFIAESPDKLRRLVHYFAALNGDGAFPPPVCNAPWVSAVIEADGSVRPCFFHPVLGNIHERSLDQILNAPEAIAFRRSLDVARDATCRKCVCTLHLGRVGL